MPSMIDRINGMSEEQKTQALLIAVAALQKASDPNDPRGAAEAYIALSRIRSL